MTTEQEKLQKALAVRFDSDAGENLSVREYLGELLLTLWEQGEGFSSKRPFGNSGWSAEITYALAKAGIVEWDKDEDGWLNPTRQQEKAADDLVTNIIGEMVKPPPQWQPIETAPKDGSYIFVTCAPAVARWESDLEAWLEPEDEPIDFGEASRDWPLKYWLPIPEIPQ